VDAQTSKTGIYTHAHPNPHTNYTHLLTHTYTGGAVAVDARTGEASLDSFAVKQAGGDMRIGGIESQSRDITVEGFSISVGGKVCVCV